ncbi:malto-oligosyltrehalose trehalohydrolase [Cellulomonas chitinilytica]|uniref:Malto-oligosyltrehalose trehalohydrolase n=1 Tax=Cellulomonas chitinilytica TaxID=398759 RepID=A0A919P3L9_9CELL|nr:malto-oligosyltrehalose trehalohydrolase [Cellulomonas chitinilytica]GIG20474.1 malto-oligosyltrehalose trehalohydrolase [Cellulomonas chitinilytica]
MTRVWAPAAGRVDVVLPATDERRPLARAGGGWWRGEDLSPGTDYGFSLDGGPVRPDPRSRWQPAGVHAPSRVLDPSAWTWTDDGWSGVDVRGRVLYELHVGTFTPGGTLDAAAEHLDELVALGVDVVELMPLAAFDGPRGWGYDGVAISAVHEPYGGPAALHRFVDAAHARGLGVCLDVVHNHLGPSGNYLAEFGPYFTDAHHTPWGAAVNLDQDGAEEVRRWVCDSALGWLRDFHLDALRLDAVHALVDGSPRHLLAQLSDEVAALGVELGRPLSLVAESDLNDPSTVTPTPDGLGMTAQWADDVHHAIHALVTGERHGYYVDFGSPQVLRTALTGAFVHAGTWSTFRGRTWGRPVPAGTDGHRFVVAASNHDQVGNRALGDRPSARLDPGLLAVEAALVVLSPFTPMLFMGEEWGASTPWQYFTSYPDAELGAAVSRGRREEFGGHGWRDLYGSDIDVPDPQSPDTFRRSVLDRSETTSEPHARVLDWYRRVVALRRSVPDLASGDLAATDLAWGDGSDDGPFRGWLVLRRGAARVVANLSDAPRPVRLDVDGPVDLAEAWEPVTVTVDGDGVVVGLGPRSVAVLVPPAG